MSNRTVRELRALAKERGLKGCCKLRKAELVSLLSVSPKKSLSGEVAFLEQLEMSGGGGGVGRSRSADALVEMTALIELCNKMTALIELCNKND